MSIEALNWVFKQQVEKSGAKFILVALANYADDQGCCYPSQETLAKMTSMVRRSVVAHLSWLEENGYISRIHRRTEKGTIRPDLFKLNLSKQRAETKPSANSAQGEPSANSAQGEPCANSASTVCNLQQEPCANIAHAYKEDPKDKRTKERDPKAHKSVRAREPDIPFDKNSTEPDSKELERSFTYPPSSETNGYVATILDGIRDKLGVILLPHESEWLRVCDRARLNGFTSEHVLETFGLMRKQGWRKGPIKPQVLEDNLTNLDKLRAEAHEQENPTNGTHNQTTSFKQQEAERSITSLERYNAIKQRVAERDAANQATGIHRKGLLGN